MLESTYQGNLIKVIKSLLPGCRVLKNDPNYTQGYPDLIVLYGSRWAVLEVKKSIKEGYQPNQEHYLSEAMNMSWSATIYPENEEEILNELQSALQPRR